jgi:hypothetical protein
LNGGYILAGGSNITLSQSNNSISIHAQSQSSDTNKAGTGFSSAGNNIGISGTLNTNGLSLSLTTPTQTNQSIGLFALGNTTQNSSTTLDARSLSFNGLGAVTVGYSNGSIQLSSPIQSLQTQSRFNLTLSGNSTSGGAGFIQVSSGVLSLAGGNNITLSQDGNAITISAANAGGAQTAISGVILSNTTYTSGSISFRDGNGISFASTTGQGISIIHDLQFTSNTSNITSNAFNTSGSSRFVQNWKLTGNSAGTQSTAIGSDLWLAGGNGVTISGTSNSISFSVATNYQSQGAYLTTAAQSNQVVNSLNGSTGQMQKKKSP